MLQKANILNSIKEHISHNGVVACNWSSDSRGLFVEWIDLRLTTWDVSLLFDQKEVFRNLGLKFKKKAENCFFFLIYWLY